MIKICSLDFINKEIFETDILDSDGNVLVQSGEQITPELLLKLYFREIYSLKSVEELYGATSGEGTVSELISEDKETAPVVATEGYVDAIDSSPVPATIPIPADGFDEQGLQELKDVVEPQSFVAEPEVKVANDIPASSTEDETASKGPVPSEINFDATSAAAGLKNAQPSVEGPAKGPHAAEIDLSQPDMSEAPGRGPVPSKFEIEDDVKVEKRTTYQAGQKVDAVEEIQEKEPESKYLKFDEAQAKRIADSSVKLAKSLGYSNSELEILKTAAYYSNIGITKFMKEDLLKNGYEKRKAYESFIIAKENLNLSDEIAETIKTHADIYESALFPLNTQIPRNHIIGIVSYYETALSSGKTKQEALDKMLQIGGNRFNIFVLHKFITMKRESSD